MARRSQQDYEIQRKQQLEAEKIAAAKERERKKEQERRKREAVGLLPVRYIKFKFEQYTEFNLKKNTHSGSDCKYVTTLYLSIALYYSLCAFFPFPFEHYHVFVSTNAV